MDLPELRTQLAKYLDKRQLAAASAVCKSWNDSFIPILYSEVSNEYVRSINTLRKHAQHVRILYIFDRLDEVPLEAFFRLEELIVYSFDEGCINWTRMSNLFSRNQGLVDLTIQGYFPVPAETMSHISSLPILRKIYFMHCELDGPSTELLFKTCLHLEQLKLYSCKLAWRELEHWEQFPSIQSLILAYIDDSKNCEEIQLIGKCPQLKSLSYDSFKEESPLVLELCRVISEKCLLLENLDFGCCEFGGEEIASIIDSTSRLKAITALFCALTAPCLDARDILGITEGSESTGEEGTGALQLTASTVKTTTTALHPREWVCTDLRALTIYVHGFAGQPPEWQQLVLRQIAKLDKLEHLDIGSAYPGEHMTATGLCLRLHAGLDTLESLRRLKSLRFIDLNPDMEEQEIYWMLNAWPELDTLSGQINSLQSRREELYSILLPKHVHLSPIQSQE
ncbi:hypothetical protein BGX27_000592 [Mortierella sp. AM989]|nr:hypothetical protein BGX27_000592 [Mortierella sp. AM989]